eukprot:TRINITY_DN27946_c0_g1_i1.p1 TRINITY_DN27946_c0_g1~~TRINITY_DN27946_c0_g1_i1.p1  ORF type:complete len:299 (+),score=40.17 TRINITY_DN27946_c0_g1_i1:1-897(+)
MEMVNIVYDPLALSLPVLDGYALPMFHKFFPLDGSTPMSSHCEPVMHLDEKDMLKAREIIKNLADELAGFKPGNFFLSIALFMEIIVYLARHEAIMTPEHQYRFVIGDVIAFMNRNLKRNIGIPELVTASKMSKRNLFRKFKLATGNTPVEYLLQLRLRKAAEMLLATNHTLSEIALECGFCDSNYLCRMFRKHMNTTPGKFRKIKQKFSGGLNPLLKPPGYYWSLTTFPVQMESYAAFITLIAAKLSSSVVSGRTRRPAMVATKLPIRESSGCPFSSGVPLTINLSGDAQLLPTTQA